MTAPLFLVAPGTLDDARDGSVVVLDGAEGRHAQAAKRMAPGEQLLVSDGTGVHGVGTVESVEPGRVAVRLLEVHHEPVPEPRLVLVQALAKEGRDEQAVEAATELGVDAVVPWASRRAIVQWRGDKLVKGRRKWTSVVTAATKQSRRFRAPEVEDLVDLRGLVARVEEAALAVVLHEEASESVNELDLPSDGDILVVVGPEGGIAPEEIDALVAAGAVPVRLGPHVLRSSSAGPAALAVLAGRLRW
ncbi:16S rRNA (uracil(1498)-N(3))-methyltransferase [Arsenicicoccus piscis]|uniref:Ribosomal RNA small subunit methyltransferase E n=1 Tax=Arsenicicoccus piscis TaxID=673954 RepID=A0ABQ6HRF2_9MICO|nr:16S rRNA (uracil(1498)-N(3))-methyltransferase [Arsenicicoccus piscis]MCH8628870.1 16S rRNA (uracil(1498)-N(3))-methyltransferase [Arsenicicoccus piscis]GMA20074.1 ribosomal RNA small subunit methyltransferase E [Arsenicicoccus piscis]